MFRRPISVSLAFFALLLSTAGFASGQDDNPGRRGRKYKPPPETAHIEVLVNKNTNGKPISSAAVIFRAIIDGKDEGNLEVKTDPDGKATIDVIPIGSTLRLQVFADGYATFAQEYEIDGAEKKIAVRLLRPRAQVSAYEDNSGKASTRKPGVQEPDRSTKPPATPPATPPPAAQDGHTDPAPGTAR